jgi:predicted regulator of Ras-like GTPase activity (Roadblock/LC7/MglB family)
MSSESDPERRLTRALVFYEDDIARIDRALATYRRSTRSQCTLLVDVEGHLVTKVGELRGVNTETISALVAACYASTREVASLIGEKEFTTLAHQGVDESIQLTLVSERVILATVYSSRTTTNGVILFYLESVLARLRAVLDAARERTSRPALDAGFGDDIHCSFDALFGDEG